MAQSHRSQYAGGPCIERLQKIAKVGEPVGSISGPVASFWGTFCVVFVESSSQGVAFHDFGAHVLHKGRGTRK